MYIYIYVCIYMCVCVCICICIRICICHYILYIYCATTFYREVMGLFMTNHGIIIQHIFESSDQKFERFQFWTADYLRRESRIVWFVVLRLPHITSWVLLDLSGSQHSEGKVTNGTWMAAISVRTTHLQT